MADHPVAERPCAYADGRGSIQPVAKAESKGEESIGEERKPDQSQEDAAESQKEEVLCVCMGWYI